ncbi:fumarylacetoacetate hydrolase family protein [Biformimicrobium ophioploci]|uniref:Fumarylacetoacetate hydrolase family protein n=1 Tax=Biformimicrobium ophioploci TaxID=3036711 RepID=A0ABQ6M0J2_9GAMM|nr:fumarylacetoacetate hydrolase family protein [Microbulbifer sp. NKW57]GMG87807.1 fumarylacetoacetate hydrolase family protein [Microbulbifer sp. NKW57]
MSRFHYSNGADVPWAPGKAVCVGRNYAEHARELDNPVPAEPLLFIKPATAMVPMEGGFHLPRGRGSCHFETELSLLIGAPLTNAAVTEVAPAIAGLGLALDLTLRDLQAELKKNGHPWEKAKAFDGSCPVSPFVALDWLPDWNNLSFAMQLNGEVRQQGNSSQMLTPLMELVSYVSSHFTLLPGDLVLTGTPAGVGPLHPGDRLALSLEDWLGVEAEAR